MLEKFGTEINKAMQAKKKHLECLTKNHMVGSQNKLEHLWSNYHGQRKKTMQQFSQQVSTALQQWEAEAHRSEEQEEKLNNLFRQQQKILQQARVGQNQKLKAIKELYEQFLKNMEEMEKSHNEFLHGAQEELKQEMATLQKKLLMDAEGAFNQLCRDDAEVTGMKPGKERGKEDGVEDRVENTGEEDNEIGGRCPLD
ncbi:Synaptonemal complex protein 3 [Oryzias melastigma]|uniref:Synaptonemal complex protein 3 n=1 Tax=Oryzias melastigma TaxID=30732 RepID=A0A834FGM9_ORYME|nr:Synaptonemal complex protein 3 [Oryzias melastigma]